MIDSVVLAAVTLRIMIDKSKGKARQGVAEGRGGGRGIRFDAIG